MREGARTSSKSAVMVRNKRGRQKSLISLVDSTEGLGCNEGARMVIAQLIVTNTGLLGLGGAALARTGLSFEPSSPASSSFLL